MMHLRINSFSNKSSYLIFFLSLLFDLDSSNSSDMSFITTAMDIAPGDVVFFKKFSTESNGDEFDKAVIGVVPETAVFHAALLCRRDGGGGDGGRLVLVHAVQESGVCREMLDDAVDKLRPDSFEIYRAQLPRATRDSACQWAESKLGAKYNDIFSPEMRDSKGNEAFYCCQLVAKSYEGAGIPDFCPPHRLNFKGSDGKILPFWEKYYRHRSLPVPQDAPGSHPGTLIRSKYLKLHFARMCQPLGKFVFPKTIDSALHFIRGARVTLTSSAGNFDVFEPRSGRVLTQCACASDEVVDEVIKDAGRAQQSWAELSAQKRGAILRKAASIIRENAEKLAYWETIDCGKPIEESRWDMANCADCFDFYAGTAHNIAGNHFPLGNDQYAYTERVPWGVVGAIGVWNYPMQTASWKIAPALMCGNAVVYKPSPLAPITSIFLAQILQTAGLPDGVLSVLQGEGETGKAICEHAGIDKVTFTGSTKTGAAVLASCSHEGSLRPATLELGGKSAVIVFEDADIDIAVTGALMANFFSQGEVCSNASKVLVHKSVYDNFRRKVVELTKNLVPNDPLLNETKIGATISREHMAKVKRFIEGARQQGAKLLCGGDEVKVKGLENGYYLSPAVLDNITEDMQVYKEEIFGAAMFIIPFDSNEDAIRMANDTPYGLAAGLFTKDLHLAYSIASKLHAGNVYVNTFNDTNAMIPFGGMKQSGFGRENGIAALEAFSQIKSTFVNASNKLDNPFVR